MSMRKESSQGPGAGDGQGAGRGFSHRDLVVWQCAMRLVREVYAFSAKFPAEERFGLTAQIRRAAVSVPSNIAEGRSRRGSRDFVQFLHIALGSLAELETQLDIARALSFGEARRYHACMELVEQVRKMLIALTKKVSSRPSSLVPRPVSR